jgi:hypothetical protein
MPAVCRNIETFTAFLEQLLVVVNVDDDDGRLDA